MTKAKQTRVFILLASGLEETDVSTVTRILRQEGVSVVLVGLTAGPIRGNYGLALMPDASLGAIDGEIPYAVIVPGGTRGVRRLAADPRVHVLLRRVFEQGGYIVVLGAASAILETLGVENQAQAVSDGFDAADVPDGQVFIAECAEAAGQLVRLLVL